MDKRNLQARRPRLTKADIVDAALRIGAEEGLGALSIRRLAEAVGASPMALYRHVADKDEILLAVTDALLASQQLPEPRSHWQDYLRQIALLLRTLLREEPVVLELFTRRPVISPAAQARLLSTVDVLISAGFSKTRATRAYATIHTYTLGFCALEQARVAHDAAPSADRSRSPAAQITNFVTDRQFLFGLDAIIVGISQPSSGERPSAGHGR